MQKRAIALIAKSVLSPALGLLCPAAAPAADLLRILPATDSVIMLHFREGHIDYNGVRPDGTYEPQTENRVYFGKLVDPEAIVDAARYRVTSGDDADYAAARRPTHVGFKAKGTEFNSPFKKPQFLREYWVYAELPAPMRPGKSYRVHVGDLAENLDEYTLTFDEKQLRSPAIHVSQAGFPPDAPKHAYFAQWMGTLSSPQHAAGALDLKRYTEGTFHICDARSGEVRKTYRGLKLQKAASTKDPSHDNWTKADVYSLDFSDFREPGRYVVAAEGMGCSHPFVIGDNVYFDAYRAAMRGVFLQRRGILKDLHEYAREYPRSHHPDINEFVAGVVEGEGKKIQDPKPVKGIWGWYADAGDWDGNPTHYIVPFSLLLAYDLRPQNFRDGDIGNRWKERPDGPWIEEGVNGLPDVLDEGRWLIDFYKRARTELVKQGLGTGGVPRYVGRDAGAHTNPSWADKRVQWVDTGAAQTTYAYAGGAAYLAHCLNKHHARTGQAGPHPESAGWIAEAKEAFAWGEARKDRSDTDKRLRQLAAVCLYLATGEPAFQDTFKAEWQNDKQRNEGAWVSPTTNQLASSIYLVSCKDRPNLDRAFYDTVRANIVKRTNFMTNNAEQTGFRFGGVDPGQWVPMNLFSVPRLLLHAVAHEVTGDRKYLDVMHTTMAYVLGGNQESRTRLSGVGIDREQDAFLCDAWYLLDFNHKAYRNPIFPGLSTYAVPMFDVGGPGSEHWARGSAIPPIAQWPFGEQRMRSRYSIAGSEFTIHQNSPWYVFAAGYLLPDKPQPIPAFSRPTVSLNLDASASIAPNARVKLSATASNSTERIEYYADWRFIGESRNAAAGFAVTWNVRPFGLKPGEQVLITAIAHDRKGESSVPTPDGEKLVRIGAARE